MVSNETIRDRWGTSMLRRALYSCALIMLFGTTNPVLGADRSEHQDEYQKLIGKWVLPINDEFITFLPGNRCETGVWKRVENRFDCFVVEPGRVLMGMRDGVYSFDEEGNLLFKRNPKASYPPRKYIRHEQYLATKKAKKESFGHRFSNAARSADIETVSKLLGEANDQDKHYACRVMIESNFLRRRPAEYPALVEKNCPLFKMALEDAKSSGAILDKVLSKRNRYIEINKQDTNGTTLLMAAAKAGRLNNIGMILQYKPNIELKDKTGKTAYDHLVENVPESKLKTGIAAVILRKIQPN